MPEPVGPTAVPAVPVVASTAARLVGVLADAGLTLAVAESLTGGLVGAAVTAVPGASVVFRGGVTAYATDLKDRLLGVDADLLSDEGPVSPRTAGQMAAGVRDRLAADCGVATTGVAGPGPQGAHPAGEVYVAAVWPGGTAVRALRLDGDRERVRSDSVEAALVLLLSSLVASPVEAGPG